MARDPDAPHVLQPPASSAFVPPPPTHDWSRFGRHRFRAPDAVVVDVPVRVEPASRLWIATLWPDPRRPDQWTRLQWWPDLVLHGWSLPSLSAAGDVVEFGADVQDRPVRWYGVLDAYEVDRWLTVQGPYADPVSARADAQRLLAPARFLPPLNPAGAAVSCSRAAHLRSRCAHRHR
jgi:hypothetical protein